MKRILTVLAIALLLGGPAAAAEKKKPGGAAQAPAAPPPLASAGSVAVSAAELREYAGGDTVGGLPARLEGRRALATKLLVRKALAAQAVREGLDRDLSLPGVMMNWKVRTLPDAYWEREVVAKVGVSDEELRAHVRPVERFHVSAIAFGDDQEALAAAREAVALLAAGADFAQLARERSVGIAAAKGGDLGWLELPSQYIEDREAAVVRATPLHGVTEPLETRIGWVVFRLNGYQSAEQVFQMEKERARGELLPERIRVAKAKKLRELRDRAVITYPEKDPFGGRVPPAVMIDGYALYDTWAPEGSPKHEFMNVRTPKEKLERFIEGYLLVREAERVGVDRDPKLAVQQELERVDALSRLYLRREVEDKLVVTEDDLRAEYKRYYVPEVYELQVVQTSSRARAEQALAQLKAGAEFKAVVKEFGERVLEITEGRIGLGPIVDYPPQLRAAIEAAPDGGLTGVVEAAPGRFMVVKRIVRRTVPVPPYEDVASRIRTRLTTRRRADLLEEYVSRFRAGLKITLDDEQLRAL